MKDKIQSAWQWLVTSSTDPERVSLTVKGFLATCVSIATPVFLLLGYKAAGGQLTEISANIVIVVQDSLVAASAAITAYGFLRKVLITLFLFLQKKNQELPPQG